MSMSMSRLIEAAKLQSCRTDVQTNCFNPELRNLQCQHANMTIKTPPSCKKIQNPYGSKNFHINCSIHPFDVLCIKIHPAILRSQHIIFLVEVTWGCCTLVISIKQSSQKDQSFLKEANLPWNDHITQSPCCQHSNKKDSQAGDLLVIKIVKK